MKLGESKDWILSDGKFPTVCDKCMRDIRTFEDRFVPMRFKSGRICVSCYRKFLDFEGK